MPQSNNISSSFSKYSVEYYGFGFNGKEMDNEVSGTGNQYDYGFRIYNPRIGKFLSEDPLTKSFPWWSPYHFAGNSPILFIDLDGLEILMPPLLGVSEVLTLGTEEVIVTQSTLKPLVESPIVKNVGRYSEIGAKTQEVLGRTVKQVKEAFKSGTESPTKSSKRGGISEHNAFKHIKRLFGENSEKRLDNGLRPDSWTKWLDEAGNWVGRLTEYKPHNIQSIGRAVGQMEKYIDQLTKQNPDVTRWIQVIETYSVVTPLVQSNPKVQNNIDLTYTVQPGDNMTKIAEQFSTTVDAISNLNNIKDPDKIKQGQTLTVNRVVVNN